MFLNSRWYDTYDLMAAETRTLQLPRVTWSRPVPCDEKAEAVGAVAFFLNVSVSLTFSEQKFPVSSM